jgi:ubiquinol-cytochrome c reductase cytochrome c1 subunit
VKYIHYYHLVDTIMTKEEAKKEAADAQIRDRDDAGEPTTRPGILTDALPSPYENREQAEAANGGAYPPDLSLMVLARHDHEDYMYALLTSYSESPPAGVDVGDKYYNP